MIIDVKYKKSYLKILISIFAYSIFLNSPIHAIILDNHDYSINPNNDYINQYLNQHLDTQLCRSYKSNNPISLKQAINITIACNRNIQKLLLNRISQNASLDVANYKFMPNLSLRVGGNYNKHDNETDNGLTKTGSVIPAFSILTPLGSNIILDWTSIVEQPNNIETFKNASKITIRQPLLKDSGYNLQTASVKNSQDENNLQKLVFYDAIEDQINQTIFLYRQIIQNKNQLTIQEKSLQSSKKLMQQTKSLIKAGRRAQYELTQVESQVASQEVNLADSKINLRQSYLNLINHLGISGDITISNNINKLPKPINKNANNLIELVTKNNISYQSLLTAQKVAKRNYYVAYDNSRWRLDLTAEYFIQNHDKSYKDTFKNQFSPDSKTMLLGVQFDIPLDPNPSRNQALLENSIRIKQLELDKRQLEQEIYANLQAKLYQHQILWDKLQLAKKAVEIKQNNFNMAKQKYEAGRLSSFELMRIQEDVENSKVLENSNHIAYLNNYTVIEKLLNNTLIKWGIDIKIT